MKDNNKKLYMKKRIHSFLKTEKAVQAGYFNIFFPNKIMLFNEGILTYSIVS